MGRFDAPRQFAARLKADTANGGAPAAAGDMATPEKQAAGDAAASRFAAGVGCSGFVSRCWRLDRPFSTQELPALCTQLPSWEDPRTGHILIVPGRHGLLFIQWEGTEKDRFLGMEAGPLPVWKCTEHVFSRPSLEKSGYLPMRFKGMVPVRVPLHPCPGNKKRPAIRKWRSAVKATVCANCPAGTVTAAGRLNEIPSPGRRSPVPSEAE